MNRGMVNRHWTIAERLRHRFPGWRCLGSNTSWLTEFTCSATQDPSCLDTIGDCRPSQGAKVYCGPSNGGETNFTDLG